FALEYCPGGSLADKLRGTPLPPREAASLVETLCQAVHAAHQQRIIHRDLKPANILLAADGTPKITDFGLAKNLDGSGLTASGVVLGTPSYMAPEQAGGRKGMIGPPTDVYALGAILYELLTGRPPFRSPTAVDTILQVLGEEPVRPRQLQPKVARDLEAICLKCLAKRPADRYPDCHSLAEDLRCWLDGKPTQAARFDLRQQLARWVRQQPVLAWGLACLLPFALAVVIAAVPSPVYLLTLVLLLWGGFSWALAGGSRKTLAGLLGTLGGVPAWLFLAGPLHASSGFVQVVAEVAWLLVCLCCASTFYILISRC